MRVLVACEFSCTVRDAFAARGHEAWSCDLLPSIQGADDLKHIQGDILDVLELQAGSFDLMIAHPPCTYLCSSGIHWNQRVEGRSAKTEEALEFVRKLLAAPIPRIALENPVGVISTRIRKPDQIIQPYQFGHPESKTTCLWLKALPKLIPTQIVEPLYYKNADGTDYRDSSGKRYSPTHYLSGRGQRKPLARWANQTDSGQNRLGPSADRWALRSITYAGIARAFAEQWG